MIKEARIAKALGVALARSMADLDARRIVRRFSMSSDAESCWHAVPEIPGTSTWR